MRSLSSGVPSPLVGIYRCFGVLMGGLNTVEMLERIHFILVRWLGGDRVKVFGGE
jgi:hypothetical protein